MRDDIEDVPGDNPSLRRALAGITARETERARRLVKQALAERGEPVDVLSRLTYDESQVLGPWMPD